MTEFTDSIKWQYVSSW